VELNLIEVTGQLIALFIFHAGCVVDDVGGLWELVGLEADLVHDEPAGTCASDHDGDAVGGERGRPGGVVGEEAEE
jgi:hypothetical protein